ncbi:MAG: NYN domain-containing protein [Coriobacteriia bacterium]|nr:NYN domain-containing protein [Coriobacteriia bacterium]MBN2847950.1 NYN domain-containing protein [Coriobacteriia bacterium]
MADESHSLAVLIDFENLAIGMERPSGKTASGRTSRAKASADVFDIKLVLERLVEKGKVIVKRAYADWGRFNQYREVMHDSGIQMMEIPERGKTGKNHADIQLCVDAMDLCYSKEHIDTFVIVSGDSDFTPLVSKLKENGKAVIGLGIKDSTSDLLASSCDEFIYYEDIVTGPAKPVVPVADIPRAKRPAMNLMIEAVQALQRENKDVMLASMVKDTMRRKQPQFSESSYGYRTFSDLLQDAERLGIITLRADQRSGTWVVAGFAEKR